MRYAAGAAAAVIAATVGWQVAGRGASPGPETSPVTITTAATVPAPASFRLQSVSTAAEGTLFALGTITCPGGPACPALAASGDDGVTWRQVHVFSGAGVLPPGLAGRPGGTGVLSQVRFANTSVGWVYGGDILRTTDGGATWQDYPHAGGDVVDLATDGTEVVLTTADRCSGGTCSGTLRVSGTDHLDVGHGDRGEPRSQPDHHSRAHLLAPGTRLCLPGDHSSCRGRRPGPSLVLRADGLHAAGPASCGHVQGPTQLVAPAAGTTLFAVCPTGGAAGHLGYAVHASTMLPRRGGSSAPTLCCW